MSTLSLPKGSPLDPPMLVPLLNSGAVSSQRSELCALCVLCGEKSVRFYLRSELSVLCVLSDLCVKSSSCIFLLNFEL
jgi:hypothetical protein